MRTSTNTSGQLQLGLGLLSIGRTWGVKGTAPPPEAEAIALLERAVGLGIRAFDTAPAYNLSEARFGKFLASLPPSDRAELMVMTKAGEHWNPSTGATLVDHGRDALIRSIERSLDLLGRIDLLQFHKATAEVVRLPDVLAAIERAKASGIAAFGVSVSDVEAAEAALRTGLFQAVQFPLNTSSRAFLPILPKLHAGQTLPIINRPFAMGALIFRRRTGRRRGSGGISLHRRSCGPWNRPHRHRQYRPSGAEPSRVPLPTG
jgi:aryl-alcohol dehydrogenase-like predicted oxidoreductase